VGIDRPTEQEFLAVSTRNRISDNFRNAVVGRFYDGSYDIEGTDLPVMTWYRQIIDYPSDGHSGWRSVPGHRDVKAVQYFDFHRLSDEWWSDWVGHQFKSVIMSPRERVPLHSELVAGCVPLVPDDVVDEFAFQCFLDWDTQIKAEFQPLDFLSSLGEIGDLIPSLSGDIGKDLSAGILGDEFGRKNFIQDVEHLSSLISIVQSKLQALRDTWGKEQRLVKRKVIESVRPEQIDEVFYEYRPGYGWRYSLVSYKATINCGCYRFHMLKDLDSTLSFIRAAFTDLGLGNPTQAIWDAIPLSFLINWFSNIGQVFDRQRIKHLFEGVWEIRHPCTSQKVEAVVRQTQENLSLGRFLMPDQVFPKGEIRVERYVRTPGIPTLRIRSRILDLSQSQLGLLAALSAGLGA
jgi:hypothetical protein